MIEIRQPLSFSEIGKKENQEDSIFPKDATVKTRVFILCDGMGGHENGEVASETVANTLGNVLSADKNIGKQEFESALSKAYDALDTIKFKTDKKPGTTMTALCLNENSYLVAHIGDSRIYHIRPSRFNLDKSRCGVVYQSSDHSLVNDLLKAGELTEEEAKNFPQKNIITRAMQPLEDRRSKADVYVFNDIEAGDYFFLCCDGILEQLSTDTLCEILALPGVSDAEKLALIKGICDKDTRDNYTCWLVPIDKVQIDAKETENSVIKASEVEDGDKAASGASSAAANTAREGTAQKESAPKSFMSKVSSFFDRKIKHFGKK